MKFSRNFVRFNWVTLILIYLVVIAGSFVRITGSGMGCPDWPKCFGQWVPPTDEAALPKDYRDVFLQKRTKKVEKFSKFLTGIGLSETAENIKKDPTIDYEEEFNAVKTWTEYVNRLLGFLAGNAMLIAFAWMLLYYRKSKLIYLAAFNLVIMAFQAWFGSIVVATNLVPWTITVHLFLALVIIGIQLFLIYKFSPIDESNKIILPTKMRWAFYLIFIITTYQLFLGTQVREYIDELTKQGYGRDSWTDKLGWAFYFHRSFSWLVLILLAVMAFYNEKKYHFRPIRWTFFILILGLISGVLLAYADMPGLVQTSHLLFATILFGQLLYLIFKLRTQKV
jgi:cytochrome c oxidase assembly protein subunit 15